MTTLGKKVRFSWWFVKAFFVKNFKFVITSFVVSFILIFFFLSIYPYINTFILKKRDIVGLIGIYTTKNIPEEITSLISNPLVSVTPAGEIVPVLADSWELLNDEKTYRFHLKKNIYWDDKKEFTAKDIQFNYKDGVTTRIIDDYTIEFILDQKLHIFPVYLTKPITKKSLTGVGGLYTVQGFKMNKNAIESVQLLPNQPMLPYKVFRFYKTEEDLIQAYKRGEITSFTTTSKKVASIFNTWNNTHVKQSIDYSRVMAMFFNTQSPFFGSRDMRKMAAYATADFPENGVSANGPIPPASWAHFDDIKQYSYNTERAQSLLDKSTDASKSATIKIRSFFEYEDVSEQIKKSLESLGLHVDLQLLSYMPDDYDMLITVWDMPEDPDQYIFWHSTQTAKNVTKYNNQKIDKLLEDGRSFVNVQQRKKIYRDFQRLLVDDLPAYFMYYPYQYTIERK